MNSKHILPLLTALFIVLAAPSRSQNIPDAHEWLTTVDRSALFARQAEPLRFSSKKNDLPAIDVNDMQQYQTMEGFGFALTGAARSC